MVNYENSKIYKIVCNKTGLCYIGSTTQSLSLRLSHHCYSYKRSLENKLKPISSSKVLENNDYSIILIENYPCKNKEELYKKEREYIEKTICVNKIQKPYRTYEEDKEYGKEYRKENKDKLAICNQIYREENKEEIFLQRKQFREDNKERLAEEKKEYYRTVIEPKKSICECGSVFISSKLEAHLKTAKHLSYISDKYGIETTTLKYFCECGSEVSNLELHYQTDKHRVYMAKRVSDEPLKIETRQIKVQTASEIKALQEAKKAQDNRVTCECGMVLSSECVLELHRDTKRHKDRLEAKNKPPPTEPISKPEPFKEFACECGMVIKQIWSVKPHLQSKTHIDTMRKKNKVNTKAIMCICGEEIKGEYRYQKHIVSEVHRNLLRKRGIVAEEVKTDEEKSIEPELETDTISTKDEIIYEVEPEIETDFTIEDETDQEAETLTINIEHTSDPVTEITTSLRDMNLTKEERTDRNKARNKEKLKCVCGVEYSRSCQARHRESKVHKDYIEAHPEQAKTNTKSGITCECGAVIGSGERNLTRHQSSEKHTKYMEAIKSGKSIEEFIQEEKDKIKAKDKARRTETILCECGTSYTKQHENRHKQTKLHIDFIHSKN